MKMKLVFTVVFCLLAFNAIFSQNSEIRIIDNEQNLFISLNGEDTSVFVDTEVPSDISLLKKVYKFPAKKNHLNVYVEWLNPLKYNIILKDSTYKNQDDLAVRKYIEQLRELYGKPDAPGISSPTKETADCNIAFQSIFLLEFIADLGKKINPGSSEICALAKELQKIEALEIKGKTRAIEKLIEEAFNLSKYSSLEDLEERSTTIKNGFDKANAEFMIFTQKVKEGAEIFTTSSDQYLKKLVIKFLDEQKTDWEKAEKRLDLLFNYLKTVRDLKPTVKANNTDYFLLSHLNFKDDDEVMARLTQKKNKFNEEDYSLVEDATLFEEKFIINKYDFIKPKVATGVFYGSTNLNSFGVATNDNGDFIVSEEVIQRNQVVTALFLNLNLDLNSRFLAPLIQIGIDPTKDNPFLLLGGGFSIPTGNFAISGGPIWTWDAKLKSLSVGDEVESTSQVEDDVEFNFDVEPKGFYIGLLYNF
ncbi:hypothetical protein [uncultured Croceitalea sp.]|uniref:hypothetical protein n=1 Tax=uncultured Croceitalea sp. TaxID=1798908 RepID=UPI0033062A27